jgi:hypothetical protein
MGARSALVSISALQLVGSNSLQPAAVFVDTHDPARFGYRVTPIQGRTEERCMAYSVVVWFVNPGEYPQQEREEELASAGRDEAPGAATGSNVGYPIPRMRYGVYETQQDAEGALKEISDDLQHNRPLRISSQASRVWLVPASRVHYVVCEEVQRPKDQD